MQVRACLQRAASVQVHAQQAIRAAAGRNSFKQCGGGARLAVGGGDMHWQLTVVILTARRGTGSEKRA